MDIKERLSSLDPENNAQELYAILDELGVSYKKTNCKKCRRDLYNIALEEVGMIEDASVESDFNVKYKYLPKRMMLWKRGDQYIKLSKDTPVEVIEQYLRETDAKGIFIKEN